MLLDAVRGNPYITAYIKRADEQMGVLGYTEHGERHAMLVSRIAQNVLLRLGYTERTAQLAGIAGYFNLIPGGHDLLTLYERARGTFKDPNVFGAFLVPALLALGGVWLLSVWDGWRSAPRPPSRWARATSSCSGSSCSRSVRRAWAARRTCSGASHSGNAPA